MCEYAISAKSGREILYTDYSLYTAVCAVCSRVFSHLWQMADHQMYTLERRRRKPEHGVRLRGSERASAREGEPPATRVSRARVSEGEARIFYAFYYKCYN